MIKIAQLIALDSPTNAGRLVDLIESNVAPLGAYPKMGRTGRKRGTRELIVHENYFVIYRILGTKVEILRVKHTSQQWPCREN